MNSSAEGRKRLAAAVKADRMRKHRTVDAARIAARISRGAWENVEAGKPVKEFTLGAIEDALDWPAGRAQELLGGGVSSELEAAARAAGLSPETIEHILRIAAEDKARTEEQGRREA